MCTRQGPAAALHGACSTSTENAGACRRQLEAIDEGIESLRGEERKLQAAIKNLQISGQDKSRLMDLQVWSGSLASAVLEAHTSDVCVKPPMTRDF